MNKKKIGLAVLALTLCIGIASAALLTYYGRIITTVNVNQAIWLDGKPYTEDIIEKFDGEEITPPKTILTSHYLESKAENPVTMQFNPTITNSTGHEDHGGITVTYCKNKLKFDIEEPEETFLLVFIDTREGGAIYDYGDTGSWRRADYMIVDPAAGAFDDWYLGKWLREEEDGYEGWSQPYDDIRTWNCEGFEAEESRTDGVTHYEFTIPLECIEYDPEYGLYVLVQTGEGFGDWSDSEIEITSPFTLAPGERLDFYIRYEFAPNLVPDIYTITTTVEPVGTITTTVEPIG